MTLTPEEIMKYKPLLLSLVPEDGDNIGNMNARSLLIEQIKKEFGKTITDDDYWTIRNSLVDDGKITPGGGRGGSICLVNATDTTSQHIQPNSNKYIKEASLYKPLHKTITENWVGDNGIEESISEITANLGSKNTGGTWTRPDIALFAIQNYKYIPSESIELITFEVKPINQYDISGVFETASHSAIAHRSYLMVHISKDYNEQTRKLLARLESQAERMHVGFITFEDPEVYETFITKVKAPRHEPDPAEICIFIDRHFSKDNGNKIGKRVKR